jgi:hypothetical protein
MIHSHQPATPEKKMKIALRNCRKFKHLEFAQSAAMHQVYWVPVLMGDDGYFWVPSTSREAGMLMRAGYESV